MSVFDAITIREVKLSIGELVKISRKNQGITQDELAERLNISRITVSNLETGKNTTLDILLKVFQYFDLLDNLNGYIAELIRLNQYTSLY